MRSEKEIEKPAFLRCCLVCNNTNIPSNSSITTNENGSDRRTLFAAEICRSAGEELTAVDYICSSCSATVDQWSDTQRALRQLQTSLVSQYRVSRKQRCSSTFTVTVDRAVVHIPYSVFLTHQRHGQRQAWSDAAHQVAVAAVQTAGIPAGVEARPPPLSPPAATHTVGCQTQPQQQEQSAAGRGSRAQSPHWASPAPLPQPRPRLPRQRHRTGSEAAGDLPTPSAEPVTPLERTELGCLRGWEGITNVQPSAPPRLAGTHKRVLFEGVTKEQAARARDLEETLSILSVADTASLLDRTETLSVLSDTAELGTLADDNLTSLDLSAAKETTDTPFDITEDRYVKPAPPSDALSVSFAEPSSGNRPPRQPARDKGEDLLREFAETMSNISEGVVLEDLEGYFEEIDRPSLAPGRVVAPPSPSRTVDSCSSPAASPAVSCSACRAELARQPLRPPPAGRHRCHLCRQRFLHICKLRQHIGQRHRGQGAAAAPRCERAEPEQQAGWSCGECGRRFSRLVTLRQHEALHRGGGHRCSHCGKAFPCKSELQRHEDTHRREKRYRCDDCGKTFQISTSLARHRTLHNGKAFACETCGKFFDRKDTMLKHQETHRTSNQHPCKLCGKLFKQRRILAKHVKLIHGGPSAFQCSGCDKAFRTHYEMEAHFRRVHGKKKLLDEKTDGETSEPAQGLDLAQPVKSSDSL